MDAISRLSVLILTVIFPSDVLTAGLKFGPFDSHFHSVRS